MVKKAVAAFLFGMIVVFGGLFGVNIEEAHAASNTAKNMTQYNQVLKSNLKNLNTSFSITYTGNQATLRKELPNLVKAQQKQEPLIAANLKTYRYKGKTVSNKLVVTYQVTYLATKAQEKYAQTESKKIARKIKASNKTNFDRVKAVNDYIVGKATYGGSTQTKYTTYGVLKNRVAVCQGYAITAYRMFKEMGIPVKYVEGRSKNVGHAWLKVKVSGQWYNLDITWNDPLPNNNYKRSYKYFLLSDSELRKTHSWNNTGLPVAKSTKFNFFKSTSSITKNGSTIYYANDKNRQRLYSYNVSTNKHKKISNTRVQYLAYKGGKIYFSNYTNHGELAVMKTNGKGQKNLNRTFTKNIYVSGKYVVYQTNNKYYKRAA